MIRSLVVFIALSSFGAAPVAAAVPMTLAGAVRYALDHSTSVALKRAALTQAESATAKQKTLTYAPVNGTLENVASKSANYGGSFALIGAQQQNVFSQNTASIGTQYALQTGGLSFLQLAQSQALAAQARAELRQARGQVAADVTAAFYGAVAKDSLVSLDRADVVYQDVLVRNARVKERAGVAAGVDVLRAQVAKAKSQSGLVGAEADAQNARESLAELIGAPLATTFALPASVAVPPLPQGSVDSLVRIAQTSRPEIDGSLASLRSAQLARREWNVDLFPSAQLSASFGNQFSPTNAVFLQNQIDLQFAANNAALIAMGKPPLPLSAKAIVPRGSPGYWQVQATSTFTFPLIDYGARHAARVNDDAQLAAAQTTLDSTLGQVELDVRQDYRAAQTALTQVSFAQDESRLGNESARIARLQYLNGLIAISDVLQAQQTALQASSDLVAARVAYVDAIVKLRVALGIYDAQSAVADL
jgi:outer membrane protein TolC